MSRAYWARSVARRNKRRRLAALRDALMVTGAGALGGGGLILAIAYLYELRLAAGL